MKRWTVLLTAIQILPLLALSQEPRPFTLQCKLPADAAGYVFLYYPSNGKWGTDSALIKDGKATIKGTVATPTLGRLSYKRKEIELFLEPTMMLFDCTTTDFDKGVMTGSETQKEYEELTAAMTKIKDRWKIVIDTISAIAKRSNTAFQELKGWIFIPYFNEIEEVSLNFINKYPTSFTAAYTLQTIVRDLETDSLKRLYSRFPATVKNSFYGKNLQKEIDNRKIGAVGTTAFKFSRKDINGNTVDLSQLTDKYVLIDFWGSWCVPCRKGNPHLRELYAKYKDRGFEIIGIAADDNTPDAWKKAVADDQLPWLHILQGNTPGTDLSDKYNVESYPTKLLVNKEGKIIGRYGEESSELDKLLASIFK